MPYIYMTAIINAQFMVPDKQVYFLLYNVRIIFDLLMV